MYKTPVVLRALLAATITFSCALPAAKEAKPPKSEGDAAPAPDGAGAMVLPEIDWWAVNQAFVEDRGAIVLSGSAWVRYKEIKLQADHIVFFRETREVYAEGNIRLREGESEMAAQVAYMDMVNDRGYLIDATVRVSEPGSRLPGQGLPSRKISAQSIASAAATTPDASIKAKDPYGVYLDPATDPQSRLNFVFHAERVVRENRYHYYAQDAFLTTDEMADPLYGVKIGRLDLTAVDQPDPENPEKMVLKPKLIRGQGARVKLGPIVLPPLPTVSYDLTRPMPYVEFDYGKSGRWGYYGSARVGWSLGGHKDRLFDPSRMYVDADLRTLRGPAAGGELRWKTGVRPNDPAVREILDRGRGFIRVYGMWEGLTTTTDDFNRATNNMLRRQLPKVDGDPRRKYDSNLLFLARRARDNAGPGQSNLYQYRDDTRYEIDFAHHQPLRHVAGINDFDLDFKYQRESDRDFAQEYFYSNYVKKDQPEGLASLRKAGDNYWAEILYRGNPQDFSVTSPRAAYDNGTFTWYEPALTYSLMPFALPKGFYINGEFQAARLRRQFDRSIIDQKDFEADRIYTKGSLERPFQFAGLNFRPHVGGQIAAYDESRDGGSTSQAAMDWGLDISKRFYAVFPGASNPELGVNGLRHIIEPRIEYIGVSNTPQDPANILDFDQVDNLHRLERVRFAVEQLFQSGRHAKDGTFAPADVVGINIGIDLFPARADRDRLLDGAWTDLAYAEGFLNVTRFLSLTGSVGYSFADSRVETASVGATLAPGGRWRVTVADRFDYHDKSRGIAGSETVFVKWEWQLSERWGFLYQQSFNLQDSLLDRKGTENEMIALTRRYGPIVGQIHYSTDRTFQNHSWGGSVSPAFTYRNLIVPSRDLLVDATEVEGDATPEERNFDPFGLMKKKKAKSTAPPSAPPPPSAPSEPEQKTTSLPPPPADARNASADSNVPAPKRAKPGTDDWATY